MSHLLFTYVSRAPTLPVNEPKNRAASWLRPQSVRVIWSWCFDPDTNPSTPEVEMKSVPLVKIDVKAALTTRWKRAGKMFLARVAQISNRWQWELALNFSAAYYSALSGKRWPERGATSWSSHSFREKKSGQQAVRSWWRFSELYFSTWELLENNSESG